MYDNDEPSRFQACVNTCYLQDDDVDLSCEILKVLFNLMTKRVGDEMVDEEEEALCVRLTSILHDILLSEAASDKKDELHR
jgi:hypothetical protein